MTRTGVTVFSRLWPLAVARRQQEERKHRDQFVSLIFSHSALEIGARIPERQQRLLVVAVGLLQTDLPLQDVLQQHGLHGSTCSWSPAGFRWRFPVPGAPTRSCALAVPQLAVLLVDVDQHRVDGVAAGVLRAWSTVRCFSAASCFLRPQSNGSHVTLIPTLWLLRGK